MSFPHGIAADSRRKALFALIKFNWECTRLLDEVLHQSFGEGEQFTLESSFFGVVADILASGVVQLPIEQISCLCLSKLGHPVADVRLRAFGLCLSLVSAEDRTSAKIECLFPAIGSQAINIYRNAQKELSVILAGLYPDSAIKFLAECTARLVQLEAPRRQATLSILPPWLAHVDLAPDTSNLSPAEAATDHSALSDLLYLTIRFSDDHLEDIRAMFSAFASHPEAGNTHALTKFLFEQGSRRKSLDFVVQARKAVACLAQTAAIETIFDDICSLVDPAAMAALPDADDRASPESPLANLDSLMTAFGSRSQVFSTGQLALLFVAELLPLRLGQSELTKRMLTLLHVSLIHCDHPGSALREHCQDVFFQILRSWTCDTSLVRPGDTAATWTAALAKITALSNSRSSIFWKAEDIGGPDSAFLVPAKMSAVIMKLLSVLLPMQPRVRQQWGEMALMWATSCPIRHLACRSFQVYRSLSPKVNARMVSDTLARLSSTIGSSSTEIQSFNLEVLRTFSMIAQNLSSFDAMKYPQLFWCTAACLTTPYEEEFAEVIELLSHILDKYNLSDTSVVRQLMAIRPKDWVGSAPHLQTLLLPGLRSAKTVMMTFDLIRRLASSPLDDLIDSPEDRLVHGFVAALPWMLQSADLGEPNEELAAMALDLAGIADAHDHASLSRLLTSFAHVRFRAKDDFVKQASMLLRDFLATHAVEIIVLLLGFVVNDTDWLREKSMGCLKLLLLFPEARAILESGGSELLLPILRLVGTKHAAQALDLLDMPTVGRLADHPKPVFGHIEPSGWCTPDAKESSRVTRENVGAVFRTCEIETRAASQHFSVVQFTDLKPAEDHTQDLVDLPSPPASSIGIGSVGNTSMGDLVGALHSLNQFFDDELDNKVMDKTVTHRYHHFKQSSDSLSERRLRVIMTVSQLRFPPVVTEIAYSRGESRARYPVRSMKSMKTWMLHANISTRFRTQRCHPRRRTLLMETRSHVDRSPPFTGVNISPLAAKEGLSSSSRRRRHHAQNPSFSSSTDVDENGEFDRIEGNLFGLEDDSANISAGSIRSHLYPASGGSTPITARRTGLYVKSEDESGATTPSPRDYETTTA